MKIQKKIFSNKKLGDDNNFSSDSGKPDFLKVDSLEKANCQVPISLDQFVNIGLG